MLWRVTIIIISVSLFQNTMKPSVVQLTPETFKSLVGERKNGETWLVDFYAPWCGPCNELAPDWNKLAKVLKMKLIFLCLMK